MGQTINTYSPHYAIHPGEYLAEILESREIKKRQFARRVGLSVKAVSRIINGKALYSPDVADDADTETQDLASAPSA